MSSCYVALRNSEIMSIMSKPSYVMLIKVIKISSLCSFLLALILCGALSTFRVQFLCRSGMMWLLCQR